VSTTEELLDRKVAAAVKITENTALRIRHADHMVPSIRKSWQSLRDRSVGIVRSRTQTTEFFFLYSLCVMCLIVCVASCAWCVIVCVFLCVLSHFSITATGYKSICSSVNNNIASGFQTTNGIRERILFDFSFRREFLWNSGPAACDRSFAKIYQTAC
jgi:hypothetical protein